MFKLSFTGGFVKVINLKEILTYVQFRIVTLSEWNLRGHLIEKMSDNKNQSSDDEKLLNLRDLIKRLNTRLLLINQTKEENGSDDRLTQMHVHHLLD